MLTELEEYIVSADKDNLDQVHSEYHEKTALVNFKEVNENNSKRCHAINNEKVIGLIMSTTLEYDEYDYLDYKCPKRGMITELIVTSNMRSKGVGKKIKIEKHFIIKGCEYFFDRCIIRI